MVKGTADISSASCQNFSLAGENPFLIQPSSVLKTHVYTRKKDNIQIASKQVLFKTNNGTAQKNT